MSEGKRRNPIGWGYVEDGLSDADRERLMRTMSALLPGAESDVRPPPRPQDIGLSESRIRSPQALAGCVATGRHPRLLHAVGRSFRDLATLRAGGVLRAPDAVAEPANASELADVLAWCADAGHAVIPFGGGSSVVGGVNPEDVGDRPVVTVSLQQLDRVLEVQEQNRVVHAEAGILGPALDAALKPHGLAVRHYPQSYFHSTLGGWVATRGAGHFSTLRAKIEDRVQALSVLLPDGRRIETRRVPASSAGIDPNRLWLGSEGALGIITDVWLRVVADPAHKTGLSVSFRDFETALQAARVLVQAELWPSQMRVLDPLENLVAGAMSGRASEGARMILGFEGERPQDALVQTAKALVEAHGGTVQSPSHSGASDWRDTFFRQPYLRDALLDHAVIADTFETAVPWSVAPGFYRTVRDTTMRAVQEVCGGGGVTCRVTHAYPDGVALYFSFYARGEHDALVSQWRELKSAASEAVMAGGGTISHHHAMGRDHKPWARQEIAAPFRAAIRAAKKELDPKGVMNPGLWFED